MIDQVPAPSGPDRLWRGTSSVPEALKRAAWAYTTRRVRGPVSGILDGERTPSAGDLVLARVEAIGSHSGLQLPDGRRRTLFVGDEIVVAFGNRYAPNQFEAVVPRNLGRCHLVAGGGVAGDVLSRHNRLAKGPTQLRPLGLLAGPRGEPINLRDHALPPVQREPDLLPPVLAVVGTSMDSGKTQSAAHLVRGLRAAGFKTGFAKVTGTGSGGDPWLLHDAGADPVLDFTDAGLVSTYLVPYEEVIQVLVTLVTQLARSGVDAIVLEVADGVIQPETAALLESAAVQRIVGGFLFAACDAMGAISGCNWLHARRLPLLGLTGVFTASPLQEREASIATGQSAYTRTDLADPKLASRLLQEARQGRRGPARILPLPQDLGTHGVTPIAKALAASNGDASPEPRASG